MLYWVRLMYCHLMKNFFTPKAAFIYRKVTALSAFYFLLLVTVTVSAVFVIRTSRSGIRKYNDLIESTLNISHTLLDMRQEVAEQQAASVRMIFNTETEDVNMELDRIDRMKKSYADAWREGLQWMTVHGHDSLVQSLLLHRKEYERETERMLKSNRVGSRFNDEAINLYYTTELPAYERYNQAITSASVYINKNINVRVDDVNRGVLDGSIRVDILLGTCFLIMVGGIAVVSRHQKKLLRTHELLLAERQRKQEEFSRYALAAQERERNQLGKELHDNVNQLLSVVKLNLRIVEQNGEMKEDLVARSINYLQTAMEEIRCLSKSLVSPFPGKVSLKKSIEDLVCAIDGATRDIRFCVSMDKLTEEKMHPDIRITAYRILQEQLNNIIKHARANVIIIEVSTSYSRLKMVVRDNGIGFDPEKRRDGVGVNNIIHRARAFHGSAVFHSSPGKGCVLSVDIPLPTKKWTLKKERKIKEARFTH